MNAYLDWPHLGPDPRRRAPQAFTAVTNLAIALARRACWSNIAEALRSYTGRPRRAVALVASAGVA